MQEVYDLTDVRRATKLSIRTLRNYIKELEIDATFRRGHREDQRVCERACKTHSRNPSKSYCESPLPTPRMKFLWMLMIFGVLIALDPYLQFMGAQPYM